MTVTITGLPLGTLQDSSLIPIETANVTAHITAASIKSYVAAASLATINATVATFGSLNTGSISADTISTTSDVGIGGNLTVSGNAALTLTTSSQPHITTLGNITTGNVNIGNLIVTGVTNVGGNIVPTANSIIGIGGPTSWFGAIYGTAVHALYADLAERYTSDSQYPPGTVVIFGTDTEVTASYQPNDPKVAGVVSTNPAYTMNSGITTLSIDVALQGRVPCQVVGTVNRGDLMVTSPIPGVAMASNNPAVGTVIGKALGNYDSSTVGVIEVVVGRL
jgi:hypothetical protein